MGLACFDFDWSLIDTDSDRFVIENLSSTLRQKLDTSPTQWTDLQNECLKEFHEQGGSDKVIRDALTRVPMDSHMIQACQLLFENGWTLAIVSDANAVYIEGILEHYKIRHLFSAIVTNPAFWDPNGRLHIQRLIPADAPPHGCSTGLCSLNICKGQEVDKLLRNLVQKNSQQVEDTIEARTARMIYVGDGQNDYCPALRMQSHQDIYFVRRGRSLEKYLTKEGQDPAVLQAIKARTVYWEQAVDILKDLQAGHYTTNHSRGAFPPYPPGSGGGPVGPGGGPPMNNTQGQGPPMPVRMGFSTGRNMAPMGLNYHNGGNPGQGGPQGGPGMGGYPGGFPPSSFMPYGSNNNNNGMGNINNDNNNNNNNSNSQMPFGHASQHTTPTHSPYSSSPSSSAYPNSSKSSSSTPLRRYILLPPPKKRKLHKTSDLGFPGIFPQRPGQDEDQMTLNNVKNGYIDKGIIQNETVSAQGILADVLQDPKKLQDLGAFMVEVLKKRQESNKIIGPSTFRPPSRATLNDQKKEQWMSDLSGSVSLRRLSKSVPHGFKGDKLLESLAQRQVPMLRATWYIKIVALSEMQANRSRPTNTQDQYSTGWTGVVNKFLTKQLGEIDPQSGSKPAASALNPGSGAQNIKPWTSEEAKEKWETKWRYSVMLTKWQYNEGLLDHRLFLRVMVEQLLILGFEQVALLLSLISMFLSEYTRSRLLMRLLIEGLLYVLQSLQRHPSYNQPAFRYGYLELELKRMIQSIFLSTPDMFVIPKAWATHSNLLQQVLLRDIQSIKDKPAVFSNVGSVLETHYKMIHARVQVFTELPSIGPELETSSARLGNNVEILDKVDHTSDLEQVANDYFSETMDSYSTTSIPSSPSKSVFSPSATQSTQSTLPLSNAGPSSQRLEGAWKSRVNTLCEWAITNSRYGHHRVYLAGTMLRIWCESPLLSPRIPIFERTSRLQGALLEFLDSFNGTYHQASHSQDAGHNHHHLQQHSTHGNEDILDAITRLFGILIHDRLFSYQQYLQRLIARGDLQPSKRSQESTLRHLKYIQSFPLHKEAQAHHLNQRRVVLFGVGGEDEYDRECFESITAQIKAKLPYMFHVEAGNMTTPVKDSPQDTQDLAAPLSVQLTELILLATRFCQLRITSQWLLDAVKSYVVKHIQIGEDNWRVMTSPGSSLLNLRQFATVVGVMEVASDFHSLYDMCTWLLDHTSDKALLTYVVNVAKKHYMVWASMGVLTKFSQAILAKMEGDLVSSKASTGTGVAIPPQIQELHSLLKDFSASAVSNLASSLHFKYGGSVHWPSRLFDGCIDILRKMDATARVTTGGSVDPTAKLEIIRASRIFAELLVEMAERVGNGCMDEVVLSWLDKHDIEWMMSALGPSDSISTSVHTDETREGQSIWFLSFMVQLVIQGFCSMEVLVQDLCGAMLNKIAVAVQQSPSHPDRHGDHHLDDMHQHQEPIALEESRLHLCKTMVSLLRVLLLEDAFSNPRVNQAYGASHHALSLEHHAHRFGIQLTISETHALQTQRYWRLKAMQQQSRPDRDHEGLETSDPVPSPSPSPSVDHPMMVVQFQICRDLVWIESCLPLSHKVLHEIQEYRKDWALSADWLRERCLSNVDGAYKMFFQTKDQQQSSEANGTEMNVDTSKSFKKRSEVVDRKMMETFQMLVAENQESLLLLDTYGDTALTPSVIHQRTIMIFSKVDRWIFDRCKVEFWLLLDTVMLERAARVKHTNGDGGVSKDGGIAASVASSVSAGAMMMMEGVTLTSGPNASIQSAAIGVNGEGDPLQQLIHIFFQEFVLSESADKELLGRMLIGMRSDAVEEFIRYGYSILAGNANDSFPYNVMIVQRPVSSADYIKIVTNFHYVMEILMKEGQPAIPLSLVSDDPPAGATPSASVSTPSASSSQQANTNPGNTAASALQGLDATQLENRIVFARSLLGQLKRFEDRVRFFDVMHAIGCSYEEASKVVQDSETGGGDMEELLLNASLQRKQSVQGHSHLMSEATSYQQQHKSSDANDSASPANPAAIHLIDLRTSLCLRLRLLVPLLPVILQHPSSTACDLTTYVIRLTNLLVSSIIHGQGSEERLFEFCLDMVSCLMDEVLLLSGGGNDSKAMRNDILSQLRTGLPQMTTSIPTVFSSRIFRILPFQQHNVYFTGLRVSSDQGSKVQKEIQPRPWDWLEDCIGDVDHQQQHQQSQHITSQSPALGLGLLDSGSSTSSSGLVNGDANSGGGLVGSSNSLSGSSSSNTLITSSSSNGENTNDTSISLTFFGAKQIRKPSEGTTYEMQFRLGHGGGDDEQELILIEEQQRPCEYNHSHQQHLLILQHQQRHEQLILQQQQQQQQKQLEDAMMESGVQNQDILSSGGNMMEMDMFGPGSSGGGSGIRSGSVPPLPRQHDNDQEPEDGEISNDEDTDMITSWDNNNNIDIGDGVNNIGANMQHQPALSNFGSTAPVTGLEEGEVSEKAEGNMSDIFTSTASPAIPVNASSVAATGISSTISVPVLPTLSSAATAAAGKKKAAVVTTKPARGGAAVKPIRGGKGSRGGKGTKAAQATTAATGTVNETAAATSSSTMAGSTMPAISNMTSMPTAVSATSAPLSNIPHLPQQQQIQGQQFQGQPQQFQTFQHQQQAFQNQMRAAAGGMSIALPPQGQHSMGVSVGEPAAMSSHQLMNILRQGNGMSGAASIGGIRVSSLNGQQTQQQQQQQQYMDPSAFLNNGNNNNNGGIGFGAGNTLNFHMGHLNNNNNGNNGGNNNSNNNNANNNGGW
ncbi:RNA polymerase II mediator complex subunit [Mortierella sp. AM989]|nr:RNA polymerase II mediator complex subunit [Mortierella sp. AM989]